MYLDFVLIRDGKTHRHETLSRRKKFLHSQIPRSRRPGSPHRTLLGSTRVGQKAEGVRGKHWREALLSCLVPSPGLIKVEECWFDVRKLDKGRHWGVCFGFADLSL